MNRIVRKRDDARRKLARVGRPRTGLNDGEFVAAEPGNDIVVAEHGAQAFRDRYEQIVADPMPDTRQPQTDQGTPDVVPDDQRVPIIKRGTPIFDVNGEKVGEVDDFSVDTGSEMLSRVSVRRGFLLGSDKPLPPGWIADVTVKGVALRVSKDQVKQLESQA